MTQNTRDLRLVRSIAWLCRFRNRRKRDMPIGRQTHSDPLLTLTMFGLVVVACVMAAAVVAEQPRRRMIQCGRCGQAIPATCAECGQSLPQEKPPAATEQPRPKSRPAPEDDGLDIVSPMIFGF